MMLRLLVLLLALGFSGAVGAATDTPDSRAARYYAQGLELPLLQLRSGALLVRACEGRLRRGCDRGQIELAANNHVLDLLDALTLFPQHTGTALPASPTNAKALREKIQGASVDLMRGAGDYDLALFARYGGTLLACPGERADAYLVALIHLRLVELEDFQGLSPEATRAANNENFAQTQAAAERWKSLPPEDCIAARKLGEFLMELMASKLRPWSDPEPSAGAGREFDFDRPRKAEPPRRSAAEDRELAHAVAGNFIAVVATELQLRVYPETAPRIKELADQAGFPSQD